MSVNKKVLVVGGGLAGTVVANSLAKRGLEVTVVEPSDYHLYQPGIVDLVVNEVKEKDILRPVEALLDKRVKLVKDRATKVDLKDRRVVTSTGKELNYDYLVLAPGVVNRPTGFPSWHTLQEGLKLKEQISTFTGKKVVVTYKLPVKCPAAPFEMAFMIKSHYPHLDVTLLLPNKEPPPIQRKMSEILAKTATSMGINVVRGADPQEINEKERVVVTPEGKYNYDLLLFDSAIKVPDEFKDLANDKGFIPVDKETLRMKGHDEVFVVGDANDIMTPPKNGAAAHFQAISASERILSEVLGNVKKEPYRGHAMCAVYVGKDKGAFVYMNFEKSYVIQPNRTFRTFKRAFTNVYWATLSGSTDVIFAKLGDYFLRKASATN